MIFADTSFWVALMAPKDAHHDQARTLLRAHADESLLVTNHIRGETWTFLRRRGGHRIAVKYLDRLERSQRVQIVGVSDEVEEQALRWLRRHDEREYSFVDATSFAVMKAGRIRDAFAFDGDFTAAGYRELRN